MSPAPVGLGWTDERFWAEQLQTDAGFVITVKLKVVAFLKIALPSCSKLRGGLPKVQEPPASGCQDPVTKLHTLACASLIDLLRL